MSEPHKHIDFCPHCGNRSPQREVFSHTYRDTWYSSDGRRLGPEEGPLSEAIVCVCETCNSVLVYDGIDHSETGYWPELVYPETSNLPKAVPETVRDIYHEASVVRQNAPNAFAILIRKSLEAICDDRSVSRGTLAARLRILAERGDIPPALAEVTDALRVVGNTAAHGSVQTITTPMTWAIDDFFRAVVEYVYIAPSKLAKFKQQLEEAEKRSAKKKAKKKTKKKVKKKVKKRTKKKSA
ncbi:MAG: DUF4145 domain-containing protein [Woeseiaceae bacterium]|nr:DUF4145 domain-containing protein [Woeseiaceae bacterium]